MIPGIEKIDVLDWASDLPSWPCHDDGEMLIVGESNSEIPKVLLDKLISLPCIFMQEGSG
jgi:hypothetical protein